MNLPSGLSRRSFLARAGAAGAALTLLPACRLRSEQSPAEEWSASEAARTISRVGDTEIRAGLEAAVLKNMFPAASEVQYPGHFVICADGGGYGGDTTWPGLDSWQMAGAYLLLGRTELVLDYFDFVRASQRKDGNIPFGIWPGGAQPGGCLSGLDPKDTFTYKPPKRANVPASAQQTRSWVGLYKHWHPKDPLGTLAPVCYVLTASEIFAATRSLPWLRERIGSLEAAAKRLLALKDDNGLVGGAGFYLELPCRWKWEGVSQCYTVHAFRELARLFAAVGESAKQSAWTAEAKKLSDTFRAAFWREDHFGEYIHPQRGLVDSHGLSDVNWAAVAFGIAEGRDLERLWPRLISEKGFWWGDMPTQIASKPMAYEKWEYEEKFPMQIDPLKDRAAMGRVWYLETVACQRMKAHDRLRESVRRVSRAAKPDGYWRERYSPRPDGTVVSDGVEKYCEYAAVLVRTVLGNREVFFDR